jgi:integrase/recombinase XerD
MSEDMQVRNLSLQTQATYVQQVSLFARHFNKSPEILGPEEIRSYQVYLTKRKEARSELDDERDARCRFLLYRMGLER